MAVAKRRREERDARVEAILGYLFDEQRAFVEDPARLKAAICTRRSGKSVAGGATVCVSMERQPGASCLVIGLTRESIKRIYWKDVLFQLNSELGLGYTFNRTELSMAAPNGSVCYFVGADSSEDEKRKFLGQKFAQVVVDEGSEYRIDLRELIYQTLKPAVADYRGGIAVIGTPGDFLGPVDAPHLFYAITREDEERREKGWTVHRWTALDNPHMREPFAEELADIDRYRPEFKETTQYLTHYLGKWPSVSDNLVYKYDAKKNDIGAAPACDTHVVACDLGFNDDTAFVVLGWRKHDPTLYVLGATKRPELDFDQVANELKRLRAAYPGARLVIDGANKQGVEHMRRVYQLPLVEAEKHGKFDYVRMMNADLQMGRIRVVASECKPLIDEWRGLEWDKRARVPKEDDGAPNHAADAALYGWRSAFHQFASPEPTPKPSRDSAEYVEALMDRRANAQAKRRNFR